MDEAHEECVLQCMWVKDVMLCMMRLFETNTLSLEFFLGFVLILFTYIFFTIVTVCN